MPKQRRPLYEQEEDDFNPQAVEALREQLNLPTVKPNNPLTVQRNNTSIVESSFSPLESVAKESKPDRPKKINIDIGEERHDRLNKLAAQVRANNAAPVPPSERMYPIHLIQIAIDHLLDGVDLDWNDIRKPEDLREALEELSVKRLKG